MQDAAISSLTPSKDDELRRTPSMGEQGEAEVRTGISASGVQVLWGKNAFLILSIWSDGEGVICTETKGETQLDPTCPYLLLFL